MLKLLLRSALATCLVAALLPTSADAQISGIRITQTGNTGLQINVDVTAFFTTGSTTSEAYLGTYYNAVPAIAWGDGDTEPRYGYGPSTGLPLISTSTVVNGIPARAYRGSFSHTYGSVGSYSIAANTNCCPITTPTYTLVTGTIVTTTVTTTGVFGPTTFTTSFVQNTLDVAAVAPAFNKVFAPDTVAIGEPSTLTFTVDNTASTLDDNNLDFTDNLPAGLVVSSPANVVNTCTGGTVTAVSGSSVVSYTGGIVAAGATCTISVDTMTALPGIYVNTSGDLTSSFGNSGTASDTLAATALPLDFAKVFAPDSVGIGVPSTLTFTVDNTNAAMVTAIDFSDTLPADLVVATPANVVNTCTGGTVTAVAGSGTVSYTGGSVAASSTCTLSVDVTSDLPAVYVNTTGPLTSTVGNSGTANDTLTVTAIPLGFTKSFDPGVVGLASASTLTFTIDNTNAATVSQIDFTDPLPAGLVIADPNNASTTCSGGTLTAVAGTDTIAFAGGSVAASSTCTIDVDVESPAPGTFDNTTGNLVSTAGNSGTADATLIVDATPLFAKAFNPEAISVGEISTLTFTIDHSAGLAAAMDLAFTDNLPIGMVVADPPNPFNSCGGTLTADADGSVIMLTGGTVAAGTTCMVGVDITVTAPGEYVNVSDPLSSNLGSTPAESATAALSGGTVLDIPTMSTSGLLGLAALLGLVAIFALRRRS